MHTCIPCAGTLFTRDSCRELRVKNFKLGQRLVLRAKDNARASAIIPMRPRG